VSGQGLALILKPGREKSLLRRHPWIFSGAVKEVLGSPASGEVIPVFSSKNEFLAQIAYSHQSQITGRVWSFLEEARIDKNFIQERISAALQLREELNFGSCTNAIRLVHAESDGLPGLIVDRYGDVLVVQYLSAGVEAWQGQIADILLDLTGSSAVFERSDAEVRALEGLEERVGLIAGAPFRDPVMIEEHGLNYRVPVQFGHKTGFYLDQRRNRLAIRPFARGKEVLDCFSYSGGFSLNALAGGAEAVTAVDESASALQLLEENLEENSFDRERVTTIQADVFKQLRKFRDQGRDFDLIVLDPPKFAPTRSQAQKAARGYKDINLLAFKLLRPGGVLFTFSCSGGIDSDLFQKIIAGAALDASVDTQILGRMRQDADHPVALNFPEGEYLKGLVCRLM
jgi:23S rRNA (cytosine1962-C5)-methyltransferase